MTSSAGARTSPASSEEKKAAPASGPHLPSMPMPHLPGVPVHGIHVGMPTGVAGRVLWWGGLATVAAFGVVDWPVAVLVGAGSWVAEQYAKAAQRQGGNHEEAS
jgi:hypothetical protein